MSKPSSSFVENVLKLVTGSVFAQGIGVLVAPIVTRLFAPEAFGVAALFASIAGIIGVVACLRYELSIMLPKTDEEAANLLGVSLFFVLIITSISALIIFFADDLIVNLLNSPELKRYLWLVPIVVFVTGIFTALNYWNSRTKHFGRLSIARVISSVVAQTTKLGAGFAGSVSGGVLIGTSILGQIVSTFVLGGQIWRDDRRLFRASIRWKKMIAGLKRYKKFPIFTTWSVLLNTISHQVPVWMLAFFFSPTVVGFYALARTILSMPAGLVGSAVAQVFLQKAAEANNRGDDLSKVVEGVFSRLIALSIFPFLLLVFIGKDFFVIVFGIRWAEAGVYTQILSLSILFSFIASPISTLFSVLEKQGSGLFFNVIFFFTRTIAIIAGGLIGDDRIALGLFAVAGVACYSLLYFWLFACVGLSLKKPLYYFAKYTLYCIPAIGVTVLTKWWLDAEPVIVLIIGLLGGIVYYFTILREDKDLNQLVHNLCQFFRKQVTMEE
jgi:O-antigen/teichoic acid export membrane protein